MDNLNFGIVNGINHKDFVYKTNNSLEINNNVVFTNNANVDNLDIRSGILNGLKLKDEIVVMDKVTEGILEVFSINKNLNSIFRHPPFARCTSGR